MITCLCKGLSDGTVRSVIDAGAGSVEAVGRACGAGTDCGTCLESIEELIDESHLCTRRSSGARGREAA